MKTTKVTTKVNEIAEQQGIRLKELSRDKGVQNALGRGQEDRSDFPILRKRRRINRG